VRGAMIERLDIGPSAALQAPPARLARPTCASHAVRPPESPLLK